MPGVFGDILGTLSKVGTGIGSVLGNKGVTGIESILGLVNQFQTAQKEKSALDRSLYYAKHPEAIAALTRQFTKPLDTGLTKGVGNIVNASLAEQGLSQAPGIQSQVLAQALAPFLQNNQSTALQEALAAIGLPTQALQALSTQQSSGGLAALLKSILPQSATPTASAGGGGGTYSDTGLTPPIFGDPSVDTGGVPA